jgi:hypothetical protein
MADDKKQNLGDKTIKGTFAKNASPASYTELRAPSMASQRFEKHSEPRVQHAHVPNFSVDIKPSLTYLTPTDADKSSGEQTQLHPYMISYQKGGTRYTLMLDENEAVPPGYSAFPRFSIASEKGGGEATPKQAKEMLREIRHHLPKEDLSRVKEQLDYAEKHLPDPKASKKPLHTPGWSN